jgi:hypothetical protein
MPKEPFLEPDSIQNPGAMVPLSCLSVPLVCRKELFSELVPLPNPGGKFPLCSLPSGMMAGGEESFFESVNGERKRKG